MIWLHAPRPEPVECVHVACGGYGCQYVAPEPPALGPALPECIIASDGSVWTTDSQGGGWVYYSAATDGVRHYRIATGDDIIRVAQGHEGRTFPAGPWWDGHEPQTPEQRALTDAWRERAREAAQARDARTRETAEANA